MKKIRYINLFYWALFLWSFSYTFLIESILQSQYGNFVGRIYTMVWLLARVLLSIKVIHDISKSGKLLFPVAAIMIIGYCSFRGNNTQFLFPLFWFAAAGKNTNIKKIINILFKAQIISVLGIVAMAVIGLLPLEATNKSATGELVYAFGFPHANTFASKITQIIMLFIAKNNRKFNPKYFVYIAVVLIVTYYLTKCRSAVLIATALVLLILINNKTYYNEKKIKRNKFLGRTMKFMKYIAFIVAAICIYLSTASSYSEGLNTLFSGRFNLATIYMNYYKINLWGQPIASYKNNREMLMKTQLYTLDNAYIYLLLGFGVVIFVIFLFAQIKTIAQLARKKQIIYILFFVVYAFWGMSETVMIRASYNFTLFIMIAVLWNKYSTGDCFYENISDCS